MATSEKAERFRALHESGCFVIANAWDAGSARVLGSLGFAALASTSLGLAYMLGRRDGQALVSREEAIANGRAIAANTDLPVSADLEDGYGPAPEDCATTVHAAIAAGLCGCTIEDTTGDAHDPIHGFDAAVARVAAAMQAARAAPHPFVLTARAENFLHGRADLDDTVRRLTAFAELGAACLYAPGLPSMDAIRRVVAAVAPKAVNVLAGPADGLLPLAALEAAGVRRVSLGSWFAHAAYGRVLEMGRDIVTGDLPSLAAVTRHREINGMMAGRG